MNNPTKNPYLSVFFCIDDAFILWHFYFMRILDQTTFKTVYIAGLLVGKLVTQSLSLEHMVTKPPRKEETDFFQSTWNESLISLVV